MHGWFCCDLESSRQAVLMSDKYKHLAICLYGFTYQARPFERIKSAASTPNELMQFLTITYLHGCY